MNIQLSPIVIAVYVFYGLFCLLLCAVITCSNKKPVGGSGVFSVSGHIDHVPSSAGEIRQGEVDGGLAGRWNHGYLRG